MQVYPYPPQILPDELTNVTESGFFCPYWRKCQPFASLQECETAKNQSNTLIECVQGVVNRTVEYLKQCSQVFRQECRNEPTMSYHMCTLFSEHRNNCHLERNAFRQICITRPLIECTSSPTGRVFDGQPTIQGIYRAGPLLELPDLESVAKVVIIIGFAVLALTSLSFYLEKNSNPSDKKDENRKAELEPVRIKI